ncbi:AraC family transcriptional regulator [Breoghania corrubedonensis]|uniref:AraC family transcriptional regulator n=1 Tax=Breoghania corrubedonensis TaxID=665038 RepID=A0A2T5V9M8_9HYPH|nr:AraC family transcriptional regulator [Breoghania corrubedonensis]PTW60458.1 AraC family transcriptional regulator [Breoghania corrubedonensis]
MFLRSFPAIEADSVDQLADLIAAIGGGTVQCAHVHTQGVKFVCRSVSAKNISIFYLNSGFCTEFSFPPADYIRIVLQIDRPCNVRIGAIQLEASPRTSGYVVPENVPLSERHPEGYKSVAVRVSASALRQRLEMLLGHEIHDTVAFEQPTRGDRRFADYFRQPLLTACHELDQIDPRFQGTFMCELEALTLTRLLLHTRHNYSDALDRKKADTNVTRLRRVEDHIHANWNKTLTLEDLAAVAELSGRTLHRSFIARHGETPHEYIKYLRLSKARAMLIDGCHASVIAVALHCGFSSLGHFARAYRERFGELPSDSIRFRK